MIVWLASYPRSGNTFLRTLLFHLYGVPSYSIYANEPDVIEVADLVGHRDLASGGLADLVADDQWHFVKTHESAHASEVGDHAAIYVVRDGRDAINSYAHFIARYRIDALPWPGRWRRNMRLAMGQLIRWHDRHHELMHRLIMTDRYGSWSQNVLGWLDRHDESPARTVVVRYEQLVSDPAKSLACALDHLGIELAPVGESMPTFEELHASNPSFFRRARVGAGREAMSDAMHEQFWIRHGEAMRRAGYDRTRSNVT